MRRLGEGAAPAGLGRRGGDEKQMSSAENQRRSVPEISFDPESGISPEDQKDILQHIEDVGLQNRIATTPEDFIVKAKKRGVLFPTLVIVAAVVALVAGGAAFYFLFQQGETKIVRGTLGTITAEGQLIQAVRQEANARISEKNQEINTIQGRLADIDKQRQDLQSNMDAKVSQREQELRAQMAAALEAEKARLEKEGLSKAVIAMRMQDLEKQRNAQLQRQLDAFRKEADAQRLLAEKNLQTLQPNFEANLAQANAEKQQALADAQKREQELKGQFSQKTATLESAQAQGGAGAGRDCRAARKGRPGHGQLTGLYGVVRDHISQHDYDKALAGLKSLRDFVDRPDIATLPALAKRHDFDVFVIDSLSSYIQGEIDKAKIDTATLLQAANQFTILRQRVSEAQDLLKAGKTQDAEKAYGEALNLIPEVATSYAYFVGRDKIAEDARQARLAQALDRAEAAFAAGNYAAASSYRAALSYMPGESERLDGRFRTSKARGSRRAPRRAAQAQTRAAARLLSQANALREGKLQEALSGYLDLIARYPLAAQTQDALGGIQVSVRSLSESAGTASKAQQTALGAQIASLQQELTARRGDIADLQAGGERRAGSLRCHGQVLQGLHQPGGPRPQGKGRRRADGHEAVFRRVLPLRSIQESFPGISDRVKRYDLGFQSAGRSDAIQDAITIVVNYSRQRTPDLKRQYIQTELKTYAKDPDMTQLLQEMDQRLAGR